MMVPLHQLTHADEYVLVTGTLYIAGGLPNLQIGEVEVYSWIKEA